MPDVGLYDVAANRTYGSYEHYLQGYAHYKTGAPWIANEPSGPTGAASRR